MDKYITLYLFYSLHFKSTLYFQVLVFLDSHCEVNAQWLEPLLARIQESDRNVAVPIIDIVNADTFEYQASPLVRGGFNWGMHFRWDNIPPNLLKTEVAQANPIV